MSNQKRLTIEEVEVIVWGFVVVAVTCILCFIVVALLYSVTFVTQPIKSMAPIDQAYTKMLNDIVLLIVGGIGGVMSKRAVGAASKAFGAPNTPQMMQPMCMPQNSVQTGYLNPSTGYLNQPTVNSSMPNFNWMGYQNPELDESWTPGPPPTTPPDHQEPDEVREEIAKARQEAD